MEKKILEILRAELKGEDPAIAYKVIPIVTTAEGVEVYHGTQIQLLFEHENGKISRRGILLDSLDGLEANVAYEVYEFLKQIHETEGTI